MLEPRNKATRDYSPLNHRHHGGSPHCQRPCQSLASERELLAASRLAIMVWTGRRDSGWGRMDLPANGICGQALHRRCHRDMVDPQPDTAPSPWWKPNSWSSWRGHEHGLMDEKGQEGQEASGCAQQARAVRSCGRILRGVRNLGRPGASSCGRGLPGDSHLGDSASKSPCLSSCP